MAQPARADSIIRIGRAVDSGLYATAIADSHVDYPEALWVKVQARPNQRVDVSWSLTCYDEGNSRSRSKDFTATTPLKRTLRIPYAEAEECFVNTLASLDDRGRVTIVLLARVPDSPPTHAVTYEVTGATATVDITYENENGDAAQVSDVPVPWTYSLDAVEGTFLYVSAQKDGSEDGNVTCSLYVDGVLREANTSAGAYVICTASDTL